jgi:hypothetical protein
MLENASKLGVRFAQLPRSLLDEAFEVLMLLAQHPRHLGEIRRQVLQFIVGGYFNWCIEKALGQLSGSTAKLIDGSGELMGCQEREAQNHSQHRHGSHRDKSDEAAGRCL